MPSVTRPYPSALTLFDSKETQRLTNFERFHFIGAFFTRAHQHQGTRRATEINVSGTLQEGLVPCVNLLWLFYERKWKAHAKSIYLLPLCILHIDCLYTASAQWLRRAFDLPSIHHKRVLCRNSFGSRVTNARAALEAIKRSRYETNCKFMNAECVETLLLGVCPPFYFFVFAFLRFSGKLNWMRREEMQIE